MTNIVIFFKKIAKFQGFPALQGAKPIGGEKGIGGITTTSPLCGRWALGKLYVTER